MRLSIICNAFADICIEYLSSVTGLQVVTSPIYRTSSLVAENVSGSVTVPAPVIAVFGIRGL